MLNLVKHNALTKLLMKRRFPFVVGKIYHIYNRGVAKCSICNGEADSWRFLQGLCLFNDIKSATNILWQMERNRGRLTLNILKDYIITQGAERKPLVRIMAYCVMGNHYHLLIEEIQESGITKFMHKLGLGYARYFNNKYDRVGSLFQDKFKNVLVDNEKHILYLLVYINVLNPADIIAPNWREEGIKDIEEVLRFAADYPWGTHQEYLGKRRSLIIEKGMLGEILPTPRAYLDLVRAVLNEKRYNEIDHLTIE